MLPGRWVGDDGLALAEGAAGGVRPLGHGRRARGGPLPAAHRLDAGRFFPFGNDADLPPDQREEDGRVGLLRLGAARRSASRSWAGRGSGSGCDSATPRGHVVARLCDVAPDGSSTLVTRGVLNLLSRHGRDRAVEWVPGTYEDVEFELNATGHAFPPGHRIRVAVSDAYWPWVWPHGERGQLTVLPAHSALLLPVRDTRGTRTKSEPVRFEEPEQAPPLPVTYDIPDRPRPERLVTHDVAAGEWTLEVDPRYGGSRTFPDGLRYEENARETYRIRSDDPLSASAVSAWTIRLARGGEWDAEIVARTELRATAAEFVMDSHLEARANGETVVERAWHRTTPRTSG